MIMRNRTHGGYKVLLDDLWEIVTEFNADMVILWGAHELQGARRHARHVRAACA